MRRATSAARNLAGLDNRDRDVGIPTLAWPPEPSDSAAGNDIFAYYIHFSTSIILSLIINCSFINLRIILFINMVSKMMQRYLSKYDKFLKILVFENVSYKFSLLFLILIIYIYLFKIAF